MTDDITLLCGFAALAGVVHTVVGPDHYLPFIGLARARGWSMRRTLALTVACGVGHVAASAVIGGVGIALGYTAFRLETVEAARGGLAGWLLLGLGLAYLAWGLGRAYRARPHTHMHHHTDGTFHTHDHAHDTDHTHVHEVPETPGRPARASRLWPVSWGLFLIFIFGPCEVLIPFLMYPAALGSALNVALVVGVFAAATIATMVIMVAVGLTAATRIRSGRLARFGDAMAGGLVAACGAALKFGL